MERDIVDIDLGIVDISSLGEFTGAGGYDMLMTRALSSMKVPYGVVSTEMSSQLKAEDMQKGISDTIELGTNKIPRPPARWIYGNNVVSPTFSDFNFATRTDHPYMVYGYKQLSTSQISGNYAFDICAAMENVFQHNVMGAISATTITAQYLSSVNSKITDLWSNSVGVTGNTTSKHGGFTNLSSPTISSTNLTSVNMTTPRLTATTVSAQNMVSHDPDSVIKDLTVHSIQTESIDRFIQGDLGDIIYLRPDGSVQKLPILNLDVYVCESLEDVEKSIGTGGSYIEDTWEQVGIADDPRMNHQELYVQSGNPVSAVAYKSTSGANSFAVAISPPKENDFISYASPNEYSDFDFRLCFRTSEFTDSFSIGILGADAGGNPHKLMFTRSSETGGTFANPARWMAEYDPPWSSFDASSPTSHVILSSMDPASDQTTGFTSVTLQRRGQVLKAWTQRFQASEVPASDSSTLFQFNLNGSYSAKSPAGTVVNLGQSFSGKVRMCVASNQLQFQVIDASDLRYERTVAYDDQLCVYNPTTDTWTVVTGLPYETCGYGRICKNVATDKCFFVRERSFERLGGDDVFTKYMEIRFYREASGGTPTIKRLKILEDS